MNWMINSHKIEQALNALYFNNKHQCDDKNYHWTEQKICNTPLFTSLKVRSTSSGLEPQRICKWLHSRWLNMVHRTCTNFSFGIYFNASRVKQICWVSCLDDVGTRRNADWERSIRSNSKHKITYLNYIKKQSNQWSDQSTWAECWKFLLTAHTFSVTPTHRSAHVTSRSVIFFHIPLIQFSDLLRSAVSKNNTLLK